jgi:dTDP-4-dehydrorhamnose 3,5-epimerase
MFIEEGLGHAFLSLENDTVVNYLCSEVFSPSTERAINPLDEKIGIPFALKLPGSNLLLSRKDETSPSLLETQSLSILPIYRPNKT